MKRGEKRPASKRGAPKLGLGAGQLSNEQISAMYSNIIQLCAQNVCTLTHTHTFLMCFCFFFSQLLCTNQHTESDAAKRMVAAAHRPHRRSH